VINRRHEDVAANALVDGGTLILTDGSTGHVDGEHKDESERRKEPGKVNTMERECAVIAECGQEEGIMSY
jgi:hypothetical protein